MTNNDTLELPRYTRAKTILKDVVGLSFDRETETITMTPDSFVRCIDRATPSPDKIVIDRDKLEGMRKSVPESKDRLNFYDFEKASTWNACIDALIAAQESGE